MLHISFVHEANDWFPKQAAQNGFTYTASNNWDLLANGGVSGFQFVPSLDDLPPPNAPDSKALWTNTKYRMLYANFGHNALDYATATTLSSTFASETQNRFLLDGLKWLGRTASSHPHARS
ncbi:hypothetical protein GCM10010276_37320 [Streptomyces longisporus]|uniref:Uncharacterized protein n=1 Tax=Streptomyces longisporus TaxID=1948 RepID=A0ABP5Z7G8_STRLO